jgi:hypothetical protein
VVVKRGLRDAEALGDLPQGGPLVALLGEKLKGDLLDARAGVAAPAGVRVLLLGLYRVHPRAVPPPACKIVGRLPADRLRPGALLSEQNLLDGRLVRNIAFL